MDWATPQMGPAGEYQWGGVGYSAASLMGGGSRCLPLGLALSPPRKLPVLLDSSLDSRVQAECHYGELGASTMDPSRALPLFLLLGKTPPPQPLPHQSLRAGNFQINLQVQNPQLEPPIPNGFPRPRI